MGRMKRTRKFAEVKRLLHPKEALTKQTQGSDKNNDSKKKRKKRGNDDDDDANGEVKQVYVDKMNQHSLAYLNSSYSGPLFLKCVCQLTLIQ